MPLKKADLHIHSYYSDGALSPQEILRKALNENLGLVAITDHNVLAGAKELKKLCDGCDIRCVAGVELDAMDNGEDIHILGYCVDLESKEFCDFVDNNLFMLNEISDKLIKKMSDCYSEVSAEEYENFNYDRKKGGWKALHYFLSKGLSDTLKDGYKFYTQFGCGYDCVDFKSIETVCTAIHNAGGKAVLAHPGKVIKSDDLSFFKDRLNEIIAKGIDGIECYYPIHSKEVEDICLKVCADKGLAVTAGSDCHGDFSGADINYMNISAEQIKGI